MVGVADDDDDDDIQLRGGDNDKLDDEDDLVAVVLQVGENDNDEHDDDDDEGQGGDAGAWNNAVPRLLIDDSVGTIVHRKLFDKVDVDEQRAISIPYRDRIVS